MRLVRLLSLRMLLAMMLLAAIPSLLVGQAAPAASAKPSEDDRIYDDVRRRLADDADVRGAGLTVTVKNGAIILEGRVRDDKARQKAPKIAKKVKGVTTVENKLKLFSES